MNNLFVYCEIEEGIIADVSLELLTKGRSLANELNCQLEAVVAGTGLKEIEKQILPYGVDKLHVFDAEGLYPYTSLPHTSILVNLFKEEQPQGATVTAEVKDNQIMIKKLPVDDLIKSIVGEEIGEIIIETLGDINYNIPYTAAFNDDSKGSILLQLKPEPLEIKYTIPTQVQTEGEEAPQITVKVTIEAEEKGQYTYKDKKLTFVIKATQVEVEGEPLENFSVTTFSFDMVKK